MLTGTLGDKLWERRRAQLGPGLAEPHPRFIGCSSVQEFGLRAGLVFVPVPAIGAVHLSTIRRITESAEMAPWSIGGSYDRPIAHRMLEEAGVDRSEFGSTKRAGITIYPRTALSAGSRDDFHQFWESTLREVGGVRHLRFWVETRLWRGTIQRGPMRVAHRVGWRGAAQAIDRRLRHPDPQGSYEFHWAVHRLRARAADALRAAEEQRSVSEGRGSATA